MSQPKVDWKTAIYYMIERGYTAYHKIREDYPCDDLKGYLSFAPILDEMVFQASHNLW